MHCKGIAALKQRPDRINNYYKSSQIPVSNLPLDKNKSPTLLKKVWQGFCLTSMMHFRTAGITSIVRESFHRLRLHRRFLL